MPATASGNRVVVGGAGIAGPTCAPDLQCAGFAVTVLEAATIQGGRMGDWDDRSLHRNSTGATRLSPTCVDMWNLLDELGIKDELLRQPDLGTGLIDTGTRTYPIDLKSIGGLVRQQGVSARAKLRLEPNRVFPMCNQRARLGLRHFDHAFGTGYVADVMPRFKEAWLRKGHADMDTGSHMHLRFVRQDQIFPARRHRSGKGIGGRRWREAAKP